MQTMTIKIPEPMLAELEQLAQHNERSKSYYVRKAIAQLLEDMEDIRIAEERLADGEELIPFSVILRENGLDH